MAALLVKATGVRHKEHNVAGSMRHHPLTPRPVSPKDLSLLLGDFSRGSYGFDEPVSRVEAKDARDLAAGLVAACEAEAEAS